MWPEVRLACRRYNLFSPAPIICGPQDYKEDGVAAMMTRTKWTKFLAMVSFGLIVACDSGGLSTADVQTAATERVRASLGLTADSTLFTDIFVGRPKDDDVVLCGTITGKTAGGSQVGPRRFVAAADPARWLYFETPAEVGQVDRIDPTAMPSMFFDAWSRLCTGEGGA